MLVGHFVVVCARPFTWRMGTSSVGGMGHIFGTAIGSGPIRAINLSQIVLGLGLGVKCEISGTTEFK